MKSILPTTRLFLRPLVVGDTAFIIRLLNSPGWLKFIGDRNVRTEQQAREYLLDGPLKSYDENGFGLAMVEIKTGHVPIGMCGLVKRNTLAHPDLGFAFLPEYTGQGYAQEAAAACLQYALHVLHLPRVLAITVAGNQASIQLLEKIGFHFEETISLPPREQDIMLFST